MGIRGRRSLLDTALAPRETGILCLTIHPETRPLDAEELSDARLDPVCRVSGLDGFEEGEGVGGGGGGEGEAGVVGGSKGALKCQLGLQGLVRGGKL